MTICSPRPNSNEQGFILLAVIWLLVLAGAVIGYLMLRAHDLSKEARAQGALEQERLALEGAIDVLVADRLVRGGSSPWSRATANGTISIDGEAIFITSTSENGRLDLLAADPVYIDRALQGLGLGREERTVLLGRIAFARSEGRKSISLPEMKALLSGQGDGTCLSNFFTSFSRMAQPQTDQMPTELARALAIPAVSDGGEAASLLMVGAPQRVEARTSKGMTLTAVIRVTGLGGQAYQSLGWLNERLCSEER